jgi:hypothetical protein
MYTETLADLERRVTEIGWLTESQKAYILMVVRLAYRSGEHDGHLQGTEQRCKSARRLKGLMSKVIFGLGVVVGMVNVIGAFTEHAFDWHLATAWIAATLFAAAGLMSAIRHKE